ncbi:MAG: RNA 2',3'-cyclic phosphodiesterase [Microgenomates group bacterium]
MRVFVALELPEEIKKEIEKIQKSLMAIASPARWVKPKAAHLTLVFLGEITPGKIPLLEKILENATSKISPVNLWLNQIGCFPSPGKARIIYLSLGGELGKLNALALKIRKGLKSQKIWFDKKPFTPHLTLGRLKKQQNLNQILQKIKISRIKFLGEKVSLIQSTLTPQGPVYKILASFELKPKS